MWVASILAVVTAAFGLVHPVPAQDGTLIVEGRRLFFAQGCHGCHTLGGAGTPIAADLSAIGRKYSRGALERWLRDPAEVEPKAHMRKLDLTDREIEALAAYLASLG
jgi:mono/diheme cytochrome c family protein